MAISATTTPELEISNKQGKPIELYKFHNGLNGDAYRQWLLTSHAVAMTLTKNKANGFDDAAINNDKLETTYEPVPMERSQIEKVIQDDEAALEITMPITQDVVKRHLSGAMERDLELEIRRTHDGGETSFLYWVGPISTITVNGSEATLRSPSVLLARLNETIPTVFYQVPCNHVLYDSRCGVIEAHYTKTATITSASGTEFTIDQRNGGVPALLNNDGTSKPVEDDYFLGGEAVALDENNEETGERRLIVYDKGTTIRINLEFPNALKANGKIKLVAGCNRDPITCRDKFNNIRRNASFFFIPRVNAFESGLINCQLINRGTGPGIAPPAPTNTGEENTNKPPRDRSDIRDFGHDPGNIGGKDKGNSVGRGSQRGGIGPGHSSQGGIRT